MSTSILVGRPDPQIHAMWESLVSAVVDPAANVDPLLAWAEERSPEAFAARMCGRRLPVLVSNNAQDELFVSDAALMLRQTLHGAGCRVQLLINQGVHAMAELPSLAGIGGLVAHQPVWDETLRFMQAHLRPSKEPPPAEAQQGEVGHPHPPGRPAIRFQLRSPEGIFVAPRFVSYDRWPPREQEAVSLPYLPISPAARAGIAKKKKRSRNRSASLMP